MTYQPPLFAAARHYARERGLHDGLAAHVDHVGDRLGQGLAEHVDSAGNKLATFHRAYRVMLARTAMRTLVSPLRGLAPYRIARRFILASLKAGAAAFFGAQLCNFVLAHLPLPPLAQTAVSFWECSLDTSLMRDVDGEILRATSASGSPCSSQVRSAPVSDNMAIEIERAIVSVEGEHDAWITLAGHDVRGPMRYLAAEIVPSLGIRGGSSPYLSAVESAADQPHAAGIQKKIANMWAASLLHQRQSDQERRHLLAEAPQLGYLRGQPISGQLFLDTLAAPLPDMLKPCLVATAYRSPVLPGRGLSEKQLIQARLCVERTLPASERAPAINAFRAYRAPSSQPLSTSAVRMIDESRGQLSGRLPDEVRLSFSLAQHAAFEKAVEGGLSAVLSKVNPALLDPDGNPNVYTSFIVAEVGQDGTLELLAAHTSHAGLIFKPPAIGYASQHKVLDLMLASRSPTGLICNRKVGAMRNTAGPPPVATCESPGAMVPLGVAIGLSINTSFAAYAEDHREDRRRLETALGFKGNEASPMRMRPLGAGGPVASAARFMEIHAALYHARHGRPARTGGLGLFQPSSLGGVDLGQAGIDPVAAARAAAHLEMPVRMGTLKSWRDAGLPNGWSAEAGKSGSGETGSDQLRGRSQTVTFTRPGENHGLIMFGWIESGDAKISVGNITHRDLRDVMAAGLTAIITTNQDTRVPAKQEENTVNE